MRTREQSFAERFWGRVNKTDGCWEWQGARQRFGYGALTVGGKQRAVHRVSWEMHFGPIPTGMFVCHRCDNPPCVNPAHLFLGTSRDNVRDMHSKGRGHALLPAPMGTHARGEAHAASVLSEADVIRIRERYAAAEPSSVLASEYGLASETIRCIGRGKTWAHVGGPRTVLGKGDRPPRGERNGHARLTEGAVRTIREAYVAKTKTVIEMANEYGISRRSVYKIINRETWNHENAQR